MIKLTTAKQGLRLPPPNVLFKTLLDAVTVTATTLLSLGVLLPGSAQAISFLGRSNINSFGANDYYDWGTLGLGTTVNNSSTVTSNLGKSATIQASASGTFQILKQSLTPNTLTGTGWNGNFTPGDNLLSTNSTGGPITITFTNPVHGALTQIQRNAFGDFTANLTAYGVNNNTLGTFSLAGLSTSNADNSAIFIGVKDSTASIAKLTFSVTGNEYFSINRFYVNTNGGNVNTTSINSEIVAVPWETDALPVVTSTILFGLGLWLKRKYQENKYSQDFNKEQVNNA
jgi:hypothetical protein